MIELMYGTINALFLEKTLCPKAFLLLKLHTFLFDNVRNDNFLNIESLLLSQNFGLKMWNFRIDQVRVQLFLKTFCLWNVFWILFPDFRSVAALNMEKTKKTQEFDKLTKTVWAPILQKDRNFFGWASALA